MMLLIWVWKNEKKSTYDGFDQALCKCKSSEGKAQMALVNLNHDQEGL